MATTLKVLGQSNPSATTQTTLYTVPASTSTVGSTLVICNQSSSTTFRVAVQPAGASLIAQHYLQYDAPINANQTLYITVGFTLAATDVVSVYAGSANVSFSLFGQENT
jgi:hypothetical protein